MKVDFANAAAAYAGAAGKARLPGLEPRSSDGADFGAVLKQAAQATVDDLRVAETQSIKGIAGKADLTQVVTAVANAEVTLQAAVAVRDRVIQAYLEIVRMPI